METSSLDWDESIIGFIIEVNSTFVSINEVDEYGFNIGKTIINIEDIIDVDLNDRYQNRLRFLHENSSKLDQRSRITIWKKGMELSEHLNYLISSKKIVTLFFDEDNYVFGLVTKFDEGALMIKNIGIEGDEDGVSCHPIDKLIGLRYDGLDEQKVKLLYENRKKFY